MSQKISPSCLKITHKIGWLILRPILKFFTDYRYLASPEFSPIKRPVLIVSNHLTTLDALIIGTVLKFNSPIYPVYFITKDTILAVPIWGGFLKLFGAFAAFRGEGLEKSLATPKEIIRSGYSVVFFPQGKRYPVFLPEQGKLGAASLALQTDAKILPMAIKGLSSFSWKNFFLRKCRVRVKIGPLFTLKEKMTAPSLPPENLEAATGIIMQEIQTLLNSSD